MKFFIYATVILGIMIMLAAAGMDMPSSSLVKSLNVIDDEGNIDFENYKSSTLYLQLLALLALATAGAVVIGVFSRSPPESYLVAGFVSLITGIIMGDMIYLFTQLASFGQIWITYGALAIFAPLSVGLIISAVSFWRGND